jgi:hypothetical protein
MLFDAAELAVTRAGFDNTGTQPGAAKVDAYLVGHRCFLHLML